jgi:hypothetical protein
MERQTVYKTWDQMKELMALKPNLRLQHKQYEYYYYIFFDEENITYFTELWTDTSQVVGINETQNNTNLEDWEDNYLADSNQPYPQHPQEFDVNVKSGNVNVVGGSLTAEAIIPRYRPKCYGSKTPILLNNSTETTLVSLDFNGQIDAININFDRDDVELVMYIDNEYEMSRAILKDLNDPTLFDFQHESCIITMRNNGKHIIFLWRTTPPDILSNLTIKAKATSASVTQMITIGIHYRMKVAVTKYTTINSDTQITEA